MEYNSFQISCLFVKYDLFNTTTLIRNLICLYPLSFFLYSPLYSRELRIELALAKDEVRQMKGEAEIWRTQTEAGAREDEHINLQLQEYHS